MIINFLIIIQEKMKTQYTIHDVAALLGISADAIRLYEKEGLVEPERNPQNGYRYYGFDQIHKIMGISLYRQLDVGIAEIREILSDQNFEGISERFSGFIDDTQKEIERLQKKAEKLSYMKQHIDSLAMGIGNCQIKDLPERYILYHQDATELLYRKVQKLITSPVFSYGNFCYRLERDEENNYKKKTLDFIVREPMMKLTEWGSDMEVLPAQKQCQCIYMVQKADIYAEDEWYLDRMLDYAAENNLACESYAYAFYVYSILNDRRIDDYYEIYLPIIKK